MHLTLLNILHHHIMSNMCSVLIRRPWVHYNVSIMMSNSHHGGY